MLACLLACGHYWTAKGFARMTGYIDDLSLDVPNGRARLAALTQIALDEEILFPEVAEGTGREGLCFATSSCTI